MFLSVLFERLLCCDLEFFISPPQDFERAHGMKALTSLRRFLSADDGTTAVEYAVLLALILVAVIVGVTSAGGGVSAWWGDIKTDLEAY